jgi:Dinucleotide-utilizing enzymes involved in molybdopterin and thiamine biosynthesis family 1
MQKILSDDFDSRSKLLLGDDFNKLIDKKITVCGIGGVGSIIPLSMVRSGVKDLTLIDFDTVDITNLNRQMAYDLTDINKRKVDAMEEKLINLRKDILVKKYFTKLDSSFDFSIFDNQDFVFDCIDDIEAKVILIKYLTVHNIPFVSSLGMGNRLDSTKITITTINKTTGDPLARKLRHLLKENEVDLSKVPVSFSSENPMRNGKIISSMVFVPNSSGLAMASFAIKTLINKGE